MMSGGHARRLGEVGGSVRTYRFRGFIFAFRNDLEIQARIETKFDAKTDSKALSESLWEYSLVEFGPAQMQSQHRAFRGFRAPNRAS